MIPTQMGSPTTATKSSCLSFADTWGRSELARGANFVYSPISIWAAMGLLAVGSHGQTLSQLLHFLGCHTRASLNFTAQELLGSFLSSPSTSDPNSAGGSLSFMSGIWIDETVSLKSNFQMVAECIYKAQAKAVDFQNNTSQVIRDINAWIEQATKGHIKDLVSEDIASPDLTFILANALYFKGMWAQEFIKCNTENCLFYLPDGSTTQVPFMTSSEEHYIEYFDSFKVLCLPYKQNNLSMLLYLPNKRHGLDELISRAISEAGFFDKYIPRERVWVSYLMVPKFKFSSRFSAREFLKKFGLEILFTERADFREMIEGDLHVDDVIHKATVEVDEEGTVATAATIACDYMCSEAPRCLQFIADHPFMFAIREESTGALLFLGHVANPSDY